MTDRYTVVLTEPSQHKTMRMLSTGDRKSAVSQAIQLSSDFSDNYTVSVFDYGRKWATFSGTSNESI